MSFETTLAPKRALKPAAIAAAVTMMLMSAAQAQQMKSHFEFKKPAAIAIPGDLSLDNNGASAPVINAAPAYTLGFEGISQYDAAAFARNFIPPDTMGAVGKSQYMETTNGAYAIFDKATGARLKLESDVAFWARAGQTGTNGDSRIMYNAAANRWVAVAFGANAKDLQIAVSDSSDALGTWKSTKFEGYAGFGFGATADYPTLALDRNAVYIGTNNFAPLTTGGTNSFRGTTMNVIPLDSLFSAGAPTVANMTQIVTPYDSTVNTNKDMGFAQQGVNSNSMGSTGKVVAASAFFYDSLGFKVQGLSSSNAVGSTVTPVTYVNQAAFETAGAGRQPSVAIPANQRVIATLDERISSSVYEVNGRIYMVNTVNSGLDALDEARVRYTVLDANTFAVLAEGDIGEAGYDFYQGSIAVNKFGQVVIGYNRSGLDATDGKIRFYGQAFDTLSDGSLSALGSAILLKESLTDDYHNGSVFGNPSAGRQRWGDYSQVSVDPENELNFYLIGQFAREYNNAAGGHPGGTGGSRWGTWIAVVNTGMVPEPSTYLMMVLGLGAVGALAKRRRDA
jgi:PEP-CTERM motif